MCACHYILLLATDINKLTIAQQLELHVELCSVGFCSSSINDK